MYLSNAYQNISDYTSAIKYNQMGFSIVRKNNNQKGYAIFLLQEGNIQHYLLNYTKAIEKYREANTYFNKLNLVREQISAINNIAIMFEYMGNSDSAEVYYSRLIELAEKSLPEKKLRMYYMNFGDFISNRNPNMALYYQKKALQISRKYKDYEDLPVLYLGFSDTYRSLGQLDLALKYTDSASIIAKERGFRRILADVDEIYSNIYAQKKDYKNAYEYLLKNKDTLLTIIGEENASQVNEFQAKYQSAEKEKKITLLNKENELKNEQIRKNNLITTIVVIALLILIILLSIIFKSLSQIKKAKKLLEEKQSEIILQKGLIEEKHNEIKDSINYAKRIQDAIFGEINNASELLPEHFVLIKPKDVVCGDFYWAHQKENCWYVAVADCTGHGVPGAMMSMLGISALNEIIAQSGLINPAHLLNLMRNKIVSEMGQTGKSLENKDGMDISLIKINLNTLEAEWAGAHNPLWIFSNNNFIELKADAQPIGHYPGMKDFTNHKIGLKKGDAVYLFTDGYADQFGGAKGKKFKYKPLQDLLSNLTNRSAIEQKEFLDKTFESWKGEYSQIDDVCIMGIKL